VLLFLYRPSLSRMLTDRPSVLFLYVYCVTVCCIYSLCLRGTYSLLPTAIKEAGEALGLTGANIRMLEGVAPKKTEKPLTSVHILRWPALMELILHYISYCSCCFRILHIVHITEGMSRYYRNSSTDGVDSPLLFYSAFILFI